VIGGLLAGLVTTLFVVPALYSLVIRDDKHRRRNPNKIPKRLGCFCSSAWFRGADE
jgi:hypothetical protein